MRHSLSHADSLDAWLRVSRPSARSLPNTEHAATRILSLPCYPELTDDEVRRVAKRS